MLSGRSPDFWLILIISDLLSLGANDHFRLAEIDLTSYSGGTAPDFHRLPFSALIYGATIKLSSIVKCCC